MKRLMLAIGVVIILAWLGFIASLYNLSSTPDTPLQLPAPTKETLLELVNRERANVGVAPMVINDDLNKVAQIKSDDMAKNNYFSHIMPSTGKNLNPEMDEILSKNCISSSENIVMGTGHFNTAGAALTWWMNSPPHRRAILNPEYTTTGFGITDNKIVESFCIAK